MRKTLTVFVVQAVFCTLASNAFSQDYPKPQDLIQAAHDAGSLNKIGPYELRATVIAYDEKSKPVTGQIKILGDGTRSRAEFQLDRYHEVRISQPGKEYIVRSLDYEPGEVHFLSGLDRSWDPLPRNPTKNFYKFGRSSKQKVHGLDAICLSEKQGILRGERLLCFDSVQHVLLRENFQQDEQIELSDYASIGPGQLFPRKIGIYRYKKPVLEIIDIEIEKKDLGENDFAVPPQSIEIEWCDNPTAPKLLSSPDPDFSDFSERRQGTKGTLYVIVDKDGSVLAAHEPHEAKVNSHDFYEHAQSAIRKWRFSPATCGSRPVAVEVVIEMTDVRGN